METALTNACAVCLNSLRDGAVSDLQYRRSFCSTRCLRRYLELRWARPARRQWDRRVVSALRYRQRRRR